MIPRFGRSVPDLSVIFNQMVRLMYDNFGQLLSSFDQRWLQQDKLASYADVIYAKSGKIAGVLSMAQSELVAVLG